MRMPMIPMLTLMMRMPHSIPACAAPPLAGAQSQGTEKDPSGSESDACRATGATAEDGPEASPATVGAVAGSATSSGEPRSGVDGLQLVGPDATCANAPGSSATGAAPVDDANVAKGTP